MIAYALLRWRGLAADAALEQLGTMHAHTREGAATKHLAWGDSLVADHPDAA